MAAAEQIPKSVEIYLNDHLAGSRAALDLMADILEGSKDEAFVAFMRQLRAEVERDRQQLEAIMSRLGVTQQDEPTCRRHRRHLPALPGHDVSFRSAAASRVGKAPVVRGSSRDGGLPGVTDPWRARRRRRARSRPSWPGTSR
jgi:hypothetical protein